MISYLLRSEERFSRNAETDLVCRLLLEKKKRTVIDDDAADARIGSGGAEAAFGQAERLTHELMVGGGDQHFAARRVRFCFFTFLISSWKSSPHLHSFPTRRSSDLEA